MLEFCYAKSDKLYFYSFGKVVYEKNKLFHAWEMIFFGDMCFSSDSNNMS